MDPGLPVKLNHRGLKSFPITETIRSLAYHLELPASMKINAVYHILLLELAAEDLYPGQIQTPLPPLVVNGQEEYVVEKVMKS